jgi:hypothetical protein
MFDYGRKDTICYINGDENTPITLENIPEYNLRVDEIIDD